MNNFYSHGKLLITGEYLVLDGALALALPTKLGQSLVVTKLDDSQLIWESYDANGEVWLEVIFELPTLKIISETFSSLKEGGNDSYALTLQHILKEAQKIQPEFLSTQQGFAVKTRLEFPQNWGLGSSSTLINNIADWARINAYQLLKNTFGGSGYDIACAQHHTPITYQLQNELPTITEVAFDPSFKEQLFFVHLNQKQNSREGIAAYRNFTGAISSAKQQISEITQQLLSCSDFENFKKLLAKHEDIIAGIIGQEPVQKRLFSDFSGQTKSLGAWGGDFMLAVGNPDTPAYFKKKGYPTVLPYSEMIL